MTSSASPTLPTIERIPVSGPSITQREIDYVTDAVTTAWYSNANVYHERFEAAFRAHLGRKYAVALPSCTSAIHLSLMALNVGPGDEVIVPDITWIASAAPVSYVGATPIFADIDRETWCLSPEAFEANITPRTKAVIPVNLYGSMPRYDELCAIARQHGIAVIEDAAESAGSTYQGKPSGSFGDTSVFSFHGSKTLTTGEGGLLATDDEAIWRRVLFLRDHGRQPGNVQFFNTEIGYKYKMSAMQAALGLAQLERLPELVAGKRAIFEWYREGLNGMRSVTLNAEPAGTLNSYWMVTAILDPSLAINKTWVIDRLAKARIDARPFFHPLSSLPAYGKQASALRGQQANRVAYEISPYGVNLPSGLNLTREMVAYVCETFQDICGA